MATEASKPSTRVPYNEADNLVIKAKLKTFEILEVFLTFNLKTLATKPFVSLYIFLSFYDLF